MAHTPLYRTLLRALSAARREHSAAAGPAAPGAARPGAAGWSRRQFLGRTAVLAGSALAPTLAPGLSMAAADLAPQTPPPGPAHRVAVVGGGICGLHAAYRLQQAGVDVVLYEASGRLGGRILTRTGALGDGLVTELGGEFINSDHTDMLTLAREFDLRIFNRAECPASRRFPNTAYLFDGARRTEAELARLLGPLAGRIGVDAALLEADPGTQLPAVDQLSVTAYLDRHADLIPQPWVRTLIEASIRTEFGLEPRLASAVQLLSNLSAVDGESVEILSQSDEAYCIQGGNGRLIAALWAALGERVHTGHPLVSVRAGPGEPVRLGFQDGREVEVDQAVIAIPFTVLRSVRIEAPLPALLRRAIAELGLGRNEKVTGAFSQRVWQRPDGFVGQAWTDLGFAEVWDASQAQLTRPDGALTYFLGADETAALAAQGNDAPGKGRAFTERLETCLPGVRAAATGRYMRSAWTRNPYSLGSYTSYQPGQLSTFGALRWTEPTEPGARREVRFDNLVFAGEHLSDAYFGYMNGGAQTGRLAAESVLRVAAARAGVSDP
ncbi:FAD-dependent oxidoreductase [uncultured Thiodictyon sp.]|jgi:monoamine oxidase|uniref:flavin monoamine oxidase family protein n=1 Tax=uncultured Thiodictyon sp. TaxID=1846217 RepID=UPI0025FD94E0|nr:FAD-dependent oxidoreductase [uncultured Thiodictyon sp.]